MKHPLLPETPSRTSSAWEINGTKPWHIGHLDEVSVDRPPATEKLFDPPYRDVPEDLSQIRFAPPEIGVPQKMTTVELVKRNGEWEMVLDGVQTDGVKSFEKYKYWLPHYRETENANNERVVSPLGIGIRLEDGEEAPYKCTVQVLQNMVDKEIELMQNEIAYEETLEPHRVSDIESQTMILPYPASITPQPYITILDLDEMRRWAARKELRKNKKNIGESRTWKVINNVLVTNNASKTNGIITSLKEALLNATGWAKLFLAAAAQTPSLKQMVESAIETRKTTWDIYEDFTSPPTNLKQYTYTISQLKNTIDTIIKTSDVANSKDWLISSSELNDASLKKDACLLYWLQYGDRSTKKIQQIINNIKTYLSINRDDDYKDSNNVVGKLLKAIYPGSGNNTPGNILIDIGTEPWYLMQTRIDYTIEITIEETNKPSVIFELKPLKASALDAGYIYAKLETKIEQLKESVKTLKEKMQANEPPSSWLQLRIFTSQTRNAEDIDQRLQNIIGPKTLNNAPTEDNLKTYEDQMEISQPVKNFAETKSYLITQYARAHGMNNENVRNLVDNAETDTNKSNKRAFWRWHDHYIQVFAKTLGIEGLKTFIVPVWTFDHKKPDIIRRLPTIGGGQRYNAITKGKATMLSVLPVPSEPRSLRIGLKEAASAAKEIWRNTASDYKTLPLVVEFSNETPSPQTSSAFHFIQCYVKTDNTTLENIKTLPTIKQHNTYANIHGLTIKQPMEIERLEAIAIASMTIDNINAINETAGNRRYGDANFLTTIKIEESRDALTAVESFAEIVAYRSAIRAEPLTRGQLVQTCVSEARTVAKISADIMDKFYGLKSKRTSIVSEEDILFSCIVGANYARITLKNMGDWKLVQQQYANNPTQKILWTRDFRTRVTIIANAVRAMARPTREPTSLPYMALQSMWYNDNPSAVRLLYESVIVQTGFELQLKSAVKAYNRVKSLLGNQTQKSQSALEQTLVSRPVMMVACANDHDNAKIMHAMQAATLFAKMDVPPAANVSMVHVRNRCALLRIDIAKTLREEPIDVNESAESLSKRLMAMNIESATQYLVPPGAIGLATPLDMSHYRTFEDYPIWLETLKYYATKQIMQPANIKTYATIKTDENIKVPRHPHIIEITDDKWTVKLSKLPELKSYDNAVATTETQPVPLLGEMGKNADKNLPSATWMLQEQTNTILWNIDRLFQVLILLYAQLKHKQTGEIYAPSRDMSVCISPPDTWAETDYVGMGVAVCIAKTIAWHEGVASWQMTLCTTNAELDPSEINTKIVAVLNLETTLSVVPVNELAIALVARL